MNNEISTQPSNFFKFHFERLSLALIYLAGIASILFYPTTKSASMLIEIILASTFLIFTLAVSNSKFKSGVTIYLKVIFTVAFSAYFLFGIYFLLAMPPQPAGFKSVPALAFLAIAFMLFICVKLCFESCMSWTVEINSEFKKLNN